MSAALIAGALELFDQLPNTDLDECYDALDRGDYLHASFYCPARTFLGAVFSGGPPEDEEYEDEEETQQ